VHAAGCAAALGPIGRWPAADLPADRADPHRVRLGRPPPRWRHQPETLGALLELGVGMWHRDAAACRYGG
jgi:hypothetical protein